MKNPLDTLRETAETVDNMGSVATLQKHLLEVVEALEKEHITQADMDFEVEKWKETLSEERRVSGALQKENKTFRGELQKAQSLNDIYEKQTLEEFNVRLKAREAKAQTSAGN